MFWLRKGKEGWGLGMRITFECSWQPVNPLTVSQFYSDPLIVSLYSFVFFQPQLSHLRLLFVFPLLPFFLIFSFCLFVPFLLSTFFNILPSLLITFFLPASYLLITFLISFCFPHFSLILCFYLILLHFLFYLFI